MSALWTYRPYDRASSIEMGRLETTAPILQAAHFHSEAQIAAVTRGCRIYSSPLGELCASAGDLVVIPAHLPHASQGIGASLVTHLYVPSDHPSVCSITAPQIIRRTHAQSPRDILDAVGSLHRDERRNEQSAPTDALSKQVVDQELDINSIAAQLGYSTDGFIRAFRRQLGMTPAAYRLAYRLMTARSQLRQGDTVADVAYATSFADQSHFGRLFRRAYGATPAVYRAAFVDLEEVDFLPDGP